MKFSYSEVWNDAVELLRDNAAIVAALAGVFIFLPMLLLTYLLPMPTPAKPEEIVRLFTEYLQTNWHWILLYRLVTMAGEIALLLLFLDARGRSVGVLIASAIIILPFYFAATLLWGLMVGVGIALLIVPGLYLIGRLALVSPELVTRAGHNPITAISRSFELTKGNGWAILGLLLLVWVAGAVIASVIGMLLGLIFLALPGESLGALMTKIVEAITSTALAAVMLALIAALYRRLAAPASAAAKAD